MDTTEQYIKMCAKATEIQTAHRFDKFDLYIRNYAPLYKDNSSYIQVCQGSLKEPRTYRILWLPRQDQLQGMAFPVINSEMIAYFLSSVLLFHENRKYQTMEQLWLAFCMKEKYGKYWIDGEWTTALSVDGKLVKWSPPDGVVGAW